MSVEGSASDPDGVSMRSINLDAASVGSLDLQMDEAIRQSILAVMSSPEQMAALSREDRQRIQQQAQGLFNEEAGPNLPDAVSHGSSSSEADEEMQQDDNLVHMVQMLYEELGSAVMTDMPTFALFDIVRAVAKLSRGGGEAQNPEDDDRIATLELLKCSSAGNLLQRLQAWPSCGQQLNACAASTDFEPLFVLAMSELRARNGGDQSQAVTDKYKMGLCDVCCSPANTLLWCRGCCETSVCVSCLHQWLVSRLGDIHTELTCPGCDSTFAPVELRHLLSEAEFRRREQLVARHRCRLRGERDCPRCSCMAQRPAKQRRKRLGWLGRKKLEKEQGGAVVTCAECSYVWCFDCHSPAHPGLSCRQFLSGAQQLESWAKQVGDGGLRKARRCPRCRVMIEKNAGCDHMTCGNCEFEFCYKCGKNWRVKQAQRFRLQGQLPARPAGSEALRSWHSVCHPSLWSSRGTSCRRGHSTVYCSGADWHRDSTVSIPHTCHSGQPQVQVQVEERLPAVDLDRLGNPTDTAVLE